MMCTDFAVESLGSGPCFSYLPHSQLRDQQKLPKRLASFLICKMEARQCCREAGSHPGPGST